MERCPIILEGAVGQGRGLPCPGNHDSNIEQLVPVNVNITTSKGMTLDDTLLVHGHSMPSDVRARVNRIVMGHIHPVFLKRGSVINGERVWLYIQARKEAIFAEKGILDIVVAPTFNPYLYSMGEKTYQKSISPIIKRINGAWREEVHHCNT